MNAKAKGANERIGRSMLFRPLVVLDLRDDDTLTGIPPFGAIELEVGRLFLPHDADDVQPGRWLLGCCNRTDRADEEDGELLKLTPRNAG